MLEAHHAAYPGWAAGEYLVIMPGNETDLQVIEDDNPVLAWCIGNVIGKPDRRGNPYPAKARPERKADAAIALIMAVGRQWWPVMDSRTSWSSGATRSLAAGRSRLCFSPATNKLNAAMRAGRLQHSGDPVAEGCVRAKPFAIGNRNPDDVVMDISAVIESAEMCIVQARQGLVVLPEKAGALPL
jgi:hypothetical protein